MIVPQIPQTKRQQALILENVLRTNRGNFGIYRIDHKALERNKYAPWGRGALGGKEVK